MNAGHVPPFLTRSQLVGVVFFAILIFLLYQMARIIAPFSSALLWAAILALALHPAYMRLLVLLKGRCGLAAGIMTLGTVLVVIGPTFTLLGILASQAVSVYGWAAATLQTGAPAEAWNRLSDFFSRTITAFPLLSVIDVRDVLLKSFGELSSGLAGSLGALLKNTALLAVDLVVLVVALFFFFRDGNAYYRAFMDVLPFTREQKHSLATKVHDTFTAVINGVFLIALLQGLLTGVGFGLFGIPFPVFWGFLAAFLALLPLGGAAFVWVPGAIYLFLNGATFRGIALVAWGVILVTLPDNVLKPLLIGKKAKIPSFILLIAIMGGLSTYGIFGILFGPVVVTLLITFLHIYREEYTEH